MRENSDNWSTLDSPYGNVQQAQACGRLFAHKLLRYSWQRKSLICMP
jgi:hypothetical protein